MSSLKKIKITNKYQPESDAVLFCGDRLELLKSLPDNSVKLVVTSPPYNIGKEYEKRRSLKTYLADQEETIKEAVRTLKDSGSLCWQVGNHVAKDGEIYPLDMLIYPIAKKYGLKLRNRIVWHFGHGLHSSKRLSGRHETIIWFTKSDDYTFNLDPIRVPQKYPGKRNYKDGAKKGELSGNPLGKNPSDVWDIPNVKSNHPEKTNHPCQFPIELIERLVLSLTDEGDVVVDPYVGVGSALCAAILHGRKGFGSDIGKKYLEIAKERIIAAADGSLKRRTMGTPIHAPEKLNKLSQMPEEFLKARSNLFRSGQ
ncbi:MAG: site-specific DNA-methyltransferase [Patescibacteria group bacterium]